MNRSIHRVIYIVHNIETLSIDIAKFRNYFEENGYLSNWLRMNDDKKYSCNLLCYLPIEDHHSFEYRHQIEKPMEPPILYVGHTIRLNSVGKVALLIAQVIGNERVYNKWAGLISNIHVCNICNWIIGDT